MTAGRLPWFCRGDVDGFFGLFVDNLLQLMLIQVLCTGSCGLPGDLVTGRILPGAAISILFGNLFYAWQARRLAMRTGRRDVTALPYGINTLSLIAYVFAVMKPVFDETRDADLAWKVGMFACLGSGVLEVAGAFGGDWLRRNTPRAALLSALAGIALTFISMGFVFQIFQSPAVAFVPAVLVLVAYAGHARFPGGLPGGLVAVAVGAASAWILRAIGWGPTGLVAASYAPALHLPGFEGGLLAFLSDAHGWKYLAVILPMGLFNVVGSLQNLESAEAAGDRFETRPSLLANGLGSVLAAFLGSPFPTTIYIGHPGWKRMGARWGYSILNGVVIAVLCLAGGVTAVLAIVPIEATLGILLWIGVVMAAQAFQEVPRSHAVAVAVGLLPSLAWWAVHLMQETARASGKGLQEVAAALVAGGTYVHGAIALSQGAMLGAMVLAAIVVFLVEQDYLRASGWALAGSLLSFVGLMHAYRLTAGGVEPRYGIGAAPTFAAAYAAAALVLLGFHVWVRPGAPADRRVP